METAWICRWQYIPGTTKHFETYPTLELAREAMAKVLNRAVDLKEYIQLLRDEEGEDCGSSADFLEKFLADLQFPESEEEIPPHSDIPDHCFLSINAEDGFWWDYKVGQYPSIHARHIYYGDDNYPYTIDVAFENPKRITPDRVNSVRIQMDERIVYSQPAYPFLIRWVLDEEPQNQTQIKNKLWEKFSTEIDRKTIGRHLALLQDLGFPVQHCPDGYYYAGEPHTPRTDIQYSPSAYPFLILQVLDCTPKTQTAFIKEIQRKYGKKIDRKAVVRNLELLNDLGYKIQRSNGGYYISK